MASLAMRIFKTSSDDAVAAAKSRKVKENQVRRRSWSFSSGRLLEATKPPPSFSPPPLSVPFLLRKGDESKPKKPRAKQLLYVWITFFDAHQV